MSSDSPPFFDATDASGTTPPVKAKVAGDNTSKNPYRHALAPASSTSELPRSVSHDTQSSSVSRPRPARAVFHDLPTAHSSITSGTARGKERTPPNTQPDAFKEEGSIPLQELGASNGKIKSHPSPPFLLDLPLPPPPTATAQHRLRRHSSSSASDFSLAAEIYNNNPQHATKQEEKGKRRQRAASVKVSSVYHTSLTAPALPTSSALKQKSRNDGRRKKHTHESYAASMPFQDLASTPAPQYTSPPMPRQSTKTDRVQSKATSSLPEGSTVGNIYRHYAQSDIFDDVKFAAEEAHGEFDLADGYPLPRGSRDYGASKVVAPKSLSDDEKQQSVRNLRQQRRTERLNSRGQPPSSALPSLPDPSSRLLPSSSQGVRHSSSYGDTQNLLELAERCPQPASRSDGRSNTRRGGNVAGFDNSPRGNSNNPYGKNRGPQIQVSRAADEEEYYEYDDYQSDVENRNQDRQPLEREVSQALRRASNFSAYSHGSIATSVAENYRYYQSEVASSNELGTIKGKAEPSEAKADQNPQAKAFYDRGVIPALWMSDNQQVRVPIQHSNRYPNSQPMSSKDNINREIGDRESDEDANDWETVGESAFGSVAMLGEGMGVHRTGSSIANTSDVETMSIFIPEISEYGSTERIAQHPGKIEYSGDYRQRDLKHTKIPVLFPVYGEHKVNGYLADSNRLRAPASAFNHTPRPLERKHTNPFNSPPPSIAAKPSGSRHSSRWQGSSKTNHFPAPASIKTDWSEDEDDIGVRRIGSTHHNRPGVAENFSRPFNSGRMDSSKDRGTNVNAMGEPGGFLKQIPRVAEANDRPSSWDHILTFARGDSVEGYNADGTRIAESPIDRGILRELSFGDHPLAAATAHHTEQKTHGRKRGSPRRSSSRRGDRGTLIKGPPGAFYHGLSKRDGAKSANERPPKLRPIYRRSNSQEPHGLRTLSLVKRHDRPVTPSMDELMDIGPDPSLSSRPGDFVYRSPMAPPKRKTWQALYTKKQLAHFEDTARAEGISGSGEFRTIDLNDGQMENGHSLSQGASSRHLGEEPHLYGGQKRERVGNRFFQPPNGIHMDMPKRKKNISVIVLCLCNLVFPSLLLYHSGHLDWLMLWLTTAEFYSMGRPHKAYALWCFIGWCIAVFFGLVGFLIYWFAIR